MPLVPAKCPSCGGDMQIDNSRKDAFCPYCGSKFLVESAVNYYNTKNEYHIEHAEFKVEDPNGLEAKLKNAETYLVKLKDYSSAEKLYLDITNEFASDWRGWWGVVRCRTKNFSGASFDELLGSHVSYGEWSNSYSIDYNKGVEQFKQEEYEMSYEISIAAKNALAVMEPATKTEYQKIWDAYVENCRRCWKKYRDRCIAEFPERKKLYLEIERWKDKRYRHRSGIGKALIGDGAKAKADMLQEKFIDKYGYSSNFKVGGMISKKMVLLNFKY